jgi:Ran GTPase-activating protein (RanGAP) involved in mRNA processing and transport
MLGRLARSFRITSLKSIRLWKVKAGDEGIRAVSNYLATNKTVTTLDVMDNGITALGCEFLGKGLHPACNQTLKKLMLDHNNIGSQGLKNLCAGLALSPSLTELSLSYCNLDKEAGKSIQLLLAFIDTTLDTLNLQGNALEDAGIKEVMEAMLINNTVTELNISDNKFSDQEELVTKICEVLKETKSLQILDLKYNELGDQAGQQIVDVVISKVAAKANPTKVDLTDRFKSKELSELFAKTMKAIKIKKGGKKKKGKGGKKKK